MRLTLCEHNLWCADIHEYPSTRVPPSAQCRVPSTTWLARLAAVFHGPTHAVFIVITRTLPLTERPTPGPALLPLYLNWLITVISERSRSSRSRSRSPCRSSRGSSRRRCSSSWRRCISSINAIKACKEAESKDASHLPVRTKPPKMKLLKRSKRATGRQRTRREKKETLQRVAASATASASAAASSLDMAARRLTVLPLCAAIDLSYPQKPTKWAEEEGKRENE